MSNQAEKIHEAATVAPHEAPLTLIERLQKQWYIIVAAALVVVVAIGGYIMYSNAQQEKNEEANTALSRIRTVFDQGEFEKALTAKGMAPIGNENVLGLEAIVEQYGGTDAGKLASLMAGNCYLNLGKYAEAQTQFEAAQSADAPVVQVGALTGLGACKEQENDWAGAAELYERAAGIAGKSGMEERCLFFAGLAYEKAGNKEKAAKSFIELVKRNEGSEFASFARTGLARLGMAID